MVFKSNATKDALGKNILLSYKIQYILFYKKKIRIIHCILWKMQIHLINLKPKEDSLVFNHLNEH